MLNLSTPVEASEPDGGANRSVLDKIERRIAKEPKYTHLPRYALLVLGTEGSEKVWIVEDGKALYVDRNGNGDLTDDGPPVKPTNVRSLGHLPNGDPKWDFDYVLDEIEPGVDSRHTEFRLARWNYGDGQDEYGLHLRLNGATPMYAGWTPFWGKSAKEAPLIHFGGPLQLRMLRFKEFVLSPGTGRLSLAFVNPGQGEGAHTRLSIDAVPDDLIPVVEIEWPVAKDSPPLRTTHRLTERCCYWEFYTRQFSFPKTAVPGTAIMTVSIPAGKLPFELASNRMEVRVRLAETEAKE
jgi:hypothetical protein